MFGRHKAKTGSLAVPDYDGRPVGDYSTTSAAVSGLQKRMHTFVHTEGLARFSTAFVADAGSRVDLVAERYVKGMGWVQDFDVEDAKQYADQADTINMLIAQFRGRYTAQGRTLWDLLFNKRSAGEVFIDQSFDESLGIFCYTPYSFLSCKPMPDPRGAPGYMLFDRPEQNFGRWVPRDQILRFWTPHPDYPLLPYSPLWAGLKDLDRFTLMGRVMDRAANSALLQRGLVWFPGEAMDETVMVDGKPVPKLARDYYASAQQTMDAKTPNDSVKAVAPFLVWWDSDLGQPERIEFKMPFGEEWMNARNAAITDFARSVDLPSVVVINGGAGGGGEAGSASNHWSELLTDRRTFDMTVGGELDNLCHEDITRWFLRNQMNQLAQRTDFPPTDEVRFWRVGYDPTKLIVNQDRSMVARDCYLSGMINLDAALARLGFRPDEKVTPGDIARLAELVTKSAQSLGITRNRQRERGSDMGGNGSSVGLPNATTAAPEVVLEDGDLIQWLAL